LDWLQQQTPHAASFWVGGFSFGAWIGMQLMMRRPDVSSFIAVSPPTNMFDFSFLSPCPVPGLITYGGQDSIVPSETVQKLVERLQKQRNNAVKALYLEDADHFYREHLETLKAEIAGYAASRIGAVREVRQEITTV
jgi:alpha/beta superfamily hydrolase